MLVCIESQCDHCGLRLTDEDVPARYTTTGRWVSKALDCPECGGYVELIAGFLKVEDK